MKLTDVTIKNLKAPETGQRSYTDDTLPGFAVRVSQGGTKSFVIVYGPTRIRRTIGRYPIISLAQARQKAREILAERTLNKGKPDKPQSLTFKEATTLFLEENYRDKRESTKKEAGRLLAKHFSAFDALPLSDVTDVHIERELKKLDHVPGEKLHAFRMANAFLRWCTRPPRRYITHNPLEGYAPPGKDGKRTRTLSDDELLAVWNACTGTHGSMTRWIILTGCRKGETLGLRKDWIQGDILTIPGPATKNGKPLTIPLLPLARSILDEQRACPSGAYFFPGRLDATTHFHRGAWDERQRELLKRSNTSGWTAHDLRRSFRSNLSRFKVPREVAERLINHAQSGLSEIYDRHDYLEEKREALLKIEAHITMLLAQG